MLKPDPRAFRHAAAELGLAVEAALSLGQGGQGLIRRGSGKALALEGGGWAGVDYALYAHPESLTGVWRSSRWMQLFAVAAAAEQSLSALGIPFEPHTPRMPFSTDFGNVSRRVPSAMIGFSRPGPEGWAVHVDEGEEQFLSDEGENLALTMSAALAVAADRLARFTAA